MHRGEQSRQFVRETDGRQATVADREIEAHGPETVRPASRRKLLVA